MVAYFPADNPRYTVLTTIETRAQAGKAYYGGPLAGPVVKRMVTPVRITYQVLSVWRKIRVACSRASA